MANFGLDKDKIEENRLRIWEELKAKQASGEKPRRREDAAAEEVQKAPGPFAGLRKAWDDVYKEADAMGYAQAVALNAKLEKKGILPEVMPRGDSPLGLDPANDAPKKSQAKRRKKGKGGKPKAKRGAGFS